MGKQPILWRDKKRYFGLPLSFTEYSLDASRIYVKRGFLNIIHDEIQLYRVRDFQVRLKITDRIFGVGDIHVVSSDPSMQAFVIENVQNPMEVKELLNEAKDLARKLQGVQATEFVGGMRNAYQ